MNDIKTILTPDFFDTYYVKSKMSYKQIANMIQNQGRRISLSSVKKYGRKFGVGRSRSSVNALLIGMFLSLVQKYLKLWMG